MKHIYLINRNSLASMYGIGTYINQLLKCLEGSKMRITLINLESSQEVLSVLEENSIRVINIPQYRFSMLDENQKRYQKYLSFLLTYYIDSNEENIFHFNFLQYSSIAKKLRELYPTCHILLTVHCINWLMELKGNAEVLQNILTKTEELRSPIEKWIVSDYELNLEFFHCVDKIICLSQYTRSLLSEQLMIAADKLEVIYNGLKDSNHCYTETECNDLRNKYNISCAEKIILFVGRVDKLKGIEALADAFRLTLKSVPNSRLIIVGGGDYNLGLQKSEDMWTKITFTGKIPKDKVEQLYQISDIGVIPSFCEQCSYTAIEMMMNRLPFIGTSSTGLKEMLDNHPEDIIPLKVENNEVVLPIEELAKRLIAHLSNPRKTEKNMYNERYSSECMKSKIIKLYSSL